MSEKNESDRDRIIRAVVDLHNICATYTNCTSCQFYDKDYTYQNSCMFKGIEPEYISIIGE